jgi:hypothetical protein
MGISGHVFTLSRMARAEHPGSDKALAPAFMAERREQIKWRERSGDHGRLCRLVGDLCRYSRRLDPLMRSPAALPPAWG